MTVVAKQIKANEIPEITLELLTGTHNEAVRAGGIFTKKDLINIKLYVKKAKALPITLGEVKTYIGYEKADIKGLEPIDIKVLFTAINAHGLEWDEVERYVIQQSIDLNNYAKKVVHVGEDIMSVIKEMPVYERLKSKDESDVKALENITYESEDHEISKGLLEVIKSMENDILKQREKTTLVKTYISDYRVTLVGGKLSNGNTCNGLEPKVKLKNDLMVSNHIDKDVPDIEKKIDKKKSRIEELKKDYKLYRALMFSGALGFGTIAISASIFGPKALNARKEKDELINEVEKLQAEIYSKKKLKKAISSLSICFTDIHMRIMEAEKALEHLDILWQSMLTSITNSYESFKNANNARSLMTFNIEFKSVISPWESVVNLSSQLIEILDEAQEEYKKILSK